jgi:transposase
MTIPGVGAVSAVAVSCWIGEIARFSNAKKLASYFGLAPRLSQSTDTEDHGHTIKEGNRMVRGLMIQVALVIPERVKDPAVSTTWECSAIIEKTKIRLSLIASRQRTPRVRLSSSNFARLAPESFEQPAKRVTGIVFSFQLS